MPKIPSHLQEVRPNLGSLKEALKTLADRPVVVNPSILLHPQIPKPMHGMAPRTVLGQAWWNREREAAYQSTNYHCEACGVSKWEAKYHQWLEAHEVYQIDYLNGRMVYERACPLCHFCHNSIHMGRLKALLERGEINHFKYAAIIQHRDSLLLQHQLELPKEYEGPFAPWKSWRLVIRGVKYPPLFQSEEEYRRHWDVKNECVLLGQFKK